MLYECFTNEVRYFVFPIDFILALLRWTIIKYALIIDHTLIVTNVNKLVGLPFLAWNTHFLNTLKSVEIIFYPKKD